MVNIKKPFALFLSVALFLILILSSSCAEPAPPTEEIVSTTSAPATVTETPPSPTPPASPVPPASTEVEPPAPTATELPPPPATTELTPPPTTTELPPPTPTKEEKGKSFVWEISSGSTHVYLLGSIHVARAGIYPLDSAMEDAFAEADSLVVEVDITDVDDAETLKLLQKYAVYPAGDGFSQNVPKDLYDKLEEYLAGLYLPIAQLEQFRPWLILITIEQLTYDNLGYVAEYGIDKYFLEKARASDKQIIELESVEFQFETLSSIPDEIIFKAIEVDLDETVNEEDVEELFTIWADGDREAMEELVFGGLVTYPELGPYYEVMFDKRNFGMLKKIEEFLAGSETYFIVVGAGHLIGDNGLLQLLEDRGYTLEQLYDLD